MNQSFVIYRRRSLSVLRFHVNSYVVTSISVELYPETEAEASSGIDNHEYYFAVLPFPCTSHIWRTRFSSDTDHVCSSFVALSPLRGTSSECNLTRVISKYNILLYSVFAFLIFRHYNNCVTLQSIRGISNGTSCCVAAVNIMEWVSAARTDNRTLVHTMQIGNSRESWLLGREVANNVIIIITWRYSLTWALASCAIRLHWSLSRAFLLHPSIPISRRSSWTSSSHLTFGLHLFHPV
jgi:hypothetical protein